MAMPHSPCQISNIQTCCLSCAGHYPTLELFLVNAKNDRQLKPCSLFQNYHSMSPSLVELPLNSTSSTMLLLTSQNSAPADKCVRDRGKATLSVSVTWAPHFEARIPGRPVPQPSSNTRKPRKCFL
ncbi:unnamed protein product [Leptidea sinapis]|uniref:Uncharacterized protein n=1 Tax=Leptidea sinapis TaxID=189913 RepID=A0A5E4Q9L9_9NEOP|nr:unnamed protein product [Leptidea sinapis]